MQSPHSFPMGPRHTATFTRGTCVPHCCTADPGQHLGCPGHPLPAAPGENRTGVQAENTLPTGRAVSEGPLPPCWVLSIPGHHRGRGPSWWGSAQQIQRNIEPWAQTLRSRKSPTQEGSKPTALTGAEGGEAVARSGDDPAPAKERWGDGGAPHTRPLRCPRAAARPALPRRRHITGTRGTRAAGAEGRPAGPAWAAGTEHSALSGARCRPQPGGDAGGPADSRETSSKLPREVWDRPEVQPPGRVAPSAHI